MGFNPGLLDFVVECTRSYGLPARASVADIGTSELFCAADPESLNRFLVHFNAEPYGGEELSRMAQRGYAGELFLRAGFGYIAVDFAQQPLTLRLDLNSDGLPRRHQGRYELVVNSGTSEHILNQYNVFKVIHEATACGGLMYHGVPMAGEFEHGIVNYNPKFFWALASANDYEIVKYWGWASAEVASLSDPILKEIPFNQRPSGHSAYLHVLLRRVNTKGFRGLVDPAFAPG